VPRLRPVTRRTTDLQRVLSVAKSQVKRVVHALGS
jgi:hypothetical protein